MGRKSESHLLDTPENRKLLIQVLSNKKNFLITDQYGSSWYTTILPDGSEIWISCRDNIIRNAGKSRIPRFNMKKLSDRLQLRLGRITYDDIHFDVNAGLKDHVGDLKEDLLQISYDDPNYTIDVGWSNDFSLDGKFRVSIVKDYEWDPPYKRIEVDNLPDLLETLQRSIDEVEKLIKND